MNNKKLKYIKLFEDFDFNKLYDLLNSGDIDGAKSLIEPEVFGQNLDSTITAHKKEVSKISRLITDSMKSTPFNTVYCRRRSLNLYSDKYKRGNIFKGGDGLKCHINTDTTVKGYEETSINKYKSKLDKLRSFINDELNIKGGKCDSILKELYDVMSQWTDNLFLLNDCTHDLFEGKLKIPSNYLEIKSYLISQEYQLKNSITWREREIKMQSKMSPKKLQKYLDEHPYSSPDKHDDSIKYTEGNIKEYKKKLDAVRNHLERFDEMEDAIDILETCLMDYGILQKEILSLRDSLIKEVAKEILNRKK